MNIRTMTPADWSSVKAVYEEGIAGGNATFQTAVPAWEAWDAGHLQVCRLVSSDHEEVLGWAALSAVSSRRVYVGVAEVSIYVSAATRGKGVGRLLLGALVAESEQNGIWTLQSGIFPENTASIALHERCGFRVVGRREKIGKMNGRWRDLMFLERRSPTVGFEDAG